MAQPSVFPSSSSMEQSLVRASMSEPLSTATRLPAYRSSPAFSEIWTRVRSAALSLPCPCSILWPSTPTIASQYHSLLSRRWTKHPLTLGHAFPATLKEISLNSWRLSCSSSSGCAALPLTSIPPHAGGVMCRSQSCQDLRSAITATKHFGSLSNVTLASSYWVRRACTSAAGSSVWKQLPLACLHLRLKSAKEVGLSLRSSPKACAAFATV